MKKLLFLFATLIGLLTSCSKEDHELTQPAAEPENSSESVPDYLNPNYVAIDWTNSKVTQYDEMNGEFAIHMSGEVPDIQPGSILTVDADTACCVCIVESCIINGHDIAVKGHSGEIYDVFGNTEMILTTDELSETDFTKALSGNILIGKPTAVIISNEDGIAESYPWKETKAYQKLIELNYIKNNMNIYSNNDVDVDIVESSLHFSLGMYFYVKFKAFSVAPKQFDMYLDGEASVTEKFGLRVKKPGMKLWIPQFKIKKDFVKLPKIRFMVGPVPVIVTVGSDLMAKITVRSDSPTYMTFGFKDELDLKVGFNWNETNGIRPNHYASNTFKILGPTLSSDGDIDVKFYVYPCFRIKLYDVIGPNIEIMPFAGTKATRYGYGTMDGNHMIGIDAGAGLSVLKYNFVLGTCTIWEREFPF